MTEEAITTTLDEPALAAAQPGPALKQEPAMHIPLGLLRPSPTNPRRKFDPAKLQELADGIRAQGGNFTPILARPNPEFTETNGQPRYEIVAGERRWRASQLAGMATVLGLVRELSDRQALLIQLQENVDRESLHELEEAEGIKRLLDETGATIDEVAAKLNKGRRWVFARLALLNLCPEARELFLADKFKATIAGIIATIPSPAEQAKAAEHIAAGWAGEPYTFRAAAEHLRKEFMLRLDSAPFDTAAPFQIAGPCTACPKRTGANADLFGEEEVKRGDMCQDRACYHAKAGEAREAKLQAAREAGHTVLSGEAARQLMPTIHYLPHGHLWLDQPAAELTADPRPLREIFGAKQRDVITVELGSGQVVSIVPEASARKVLKAKGLLRAEEPKSAPKAQLSDAASGQAREAAQEQASAPAAKPAAQPRSQQALAREVDIRHGELLGQMIFKALGDQLAAADTLPLLGLKLAIVKLLEDASANAIHLLFEAHGWAVPPWGSTFVGELRRHLDQVAQEEDGGLQLGQLLIEALVVEQLTDGESLEYLRDCEGQPAIAMAEHLQIDLDAIDAEAKEGARVQIYQEEARRLGIDPEQVGQQQEDAGQAFAKAHGKAAPVKYRNAATGETWSGRGLQPKWLKVAISGGAALSDFEVVA